MTQHFIKTKDIMNKDASTDSFAKHFKKQDTGHKDKATAKQIRDRTLVKYCGRVIPFLPINILENYIEHCV